MKQIKLNKSINIGVDIGGSHIGLGLVNDAGKILFKTTFNYPKNSTADFIISEIVKYIIMLNNKSIEYNKTPVSNIGIGIPGIIDVKKGIVETSPNIAQFKAFKIIEQITKKLQKNKINSKIFIENDANCAAFAEAQFGWGKHLKKDNLIHLTLGTGVGGGIIFNKKIYSGCSNNASEPGHLTIKFDGRVCNCKNIGCLEAYCGAAGLLKTAEEYINNSNNRNILKYCRGNIKFLSAEIIGRSAKNGDKSALAIFDEYGKHLAIGIASLINIFNIELITLGGGIAQSGAFFIKSLTDEVRKRAFKIPLENCEIKISRLGTDAGIIGAAALNKIAEIK